MITDRRIFKLSKKYGPDLAVLITFLYHCNPTMKAIRLDTSQIAVELGISKSTVNRLLKKLVEKGYLQILKRSVYTLTHKFYFEHSDYISYEYQK